MVKIVTTGEEICAFSAYNVLQMGDMRSVGPRGPSGPAIRPMTTPVGARGIHPGAHQMMQHQMATVQVGA